MTLKQNHQVTSNKSLSDFSFQVILKWHQNIALAANWCQKSLNIHLDKFWHHHVFKAIENFLSVPQELSGARQIQQNTKEMSALKSQEWLGEIQGHIRRKFFSRGTPEACSSDFHHLQVQEVGQGCVASFCLCGTSNCDLPLWCCAVPWWLQCHIG